MTASKLYTTVFDRTLPPLDVATANLKNEYDSLVYSFGVPIADEVFWESPSVLTYAVCTPPRRKGVVEFLETLPAGSHVLIFGGLPLFLATKRAQRIPCVFHYTDPRPNFAHMAEQLARASDVCLEEDSRRDYDAVITVGMVEFLGPENRRSYMTAITNKLAAGGYLFVEEPDANSPLPTDNIHMFLDTLGLVQRELGGRVWCKPVPGGTTNATNGE